MIDVDETFDKNDLEFLAHCVDYVNSLIDHQPDTAYIADKVRYILNKVLDAASHQSRYLNLEVIHKDEQRQPKGQI